MIPPSKLPFPESAEVQSVFQKVPSSFDFPAAEKKILDFWEARKIYQKSLDQRRGNRHLHFAKHDQMFELN